MFSLPGSQLPPIRGDDSDPKCASSNAISPERASTSKLTLDHAPPQQKPRRLTPVHSTTSSSVFIPRTSRTSTGFKKPITKMTHTELHALIERNTRLLCNESVVSKLKHAQRRLVEDDLEAAKRRLERLSMQSEGGQTTLAYTLSDLTLRGAADGESCADVKRRLTSCQTPAYGVESHATHTNTTVLLSNAESTSIQTRLYEAAQQERQQRKVLRGLELMTGLGRRLGDVGVDHSGVDADADVDSDEDGNEDADTDEDEDEDITQRYHDDGDGDGDG